MNKPRVLLEDGSKKRRLIVTLQEYMERPLLNLRYWYEDKKTKEMKPTRNGVTLNRTNYLALKSSITDHHDEIMEYLDVSSHNVTAAGDGKIVNEFVSGQQSSVENIDVVFDHIRPKTKLYEISYRGSQVDLVLNRSHDFFACESLSTDILSDHFKKLMGIMAVSFDLALQNSKGSEPTSPTVIAEQVEFDFSKNLRILSRVST